MPSDALSAAWHMCAGDGQGGFLDTGFDTLGSGEKTQAIALVDLLGSGSLSVLVGNKGHCNRVLLSYIPGGLEKNTEMASQSSSRNTLAVALGDIDRDGCAQPSDRVAHPTHPVHPASTRSLDIVEANDAQSASRIIFRQSPTYPSTHEITLSSDTDQGLPNLIETSLVALGDLNGDGWCPTRTITLSTPPKPT